jgi:phytoene synthase
MTPDAYCQERAARSGSSFYYSFLFLPPPQRRAITALYAFCREVDDVVDETTDPSVARLKLAWWRTEIDNLGSDRAQHPVTKALGAAATAFDLPASRLHEIVDGMQMDLDVARYRDFDALRLYCHRVAGVVGILSATIFGYGNERTLAYAESLGLAFQLTNLIRDVGEDAVRGRIYLPADELARYGVSEAQVLERRETPAFLELMEFQVARARAQYDRAMALLPAEDRRAQRAGLVMAAIYRRTLDVVAADGCHVLTKRASLTPLRKLWLAWSTWMRN